MIRTANQFSTGIRLLALIPALLLFHHAATAQIIYPKNSKAPELHFEKWVNQAGNGEQIAGKHLVLDFWATWCGPCIKAIPHLNQLTDKYKDEIAFISINSYDDLEKISQFLENVPIHGFVYHDSAKTMGNALDVKKIPSAILVDKNRDLRWMGYAGNLTDQLLDIYLKTDTVFDQKLDPVIIKTTDFLPVAGQDDISIDIDIRKSVYDDMAISTQSVALYFSGNFYVLYENLTAPSIMAFLYTRQANHEKTQEDLISEFRVRGIEPTAGIDLTAKSSSEAHETYLLGHLIKTVSKALHIKLDTLAEEQDIWYATIDPKQLDRHRSILPNGDFEFKKYSSGDIRISNIRPARLGIILQKYLGGKVSGLFNDHTQYDLQLKHTDDPQKLAAYLQSEYGITLTKRRGKAKVLLMTFE